MPTYSNCGSRLLLLIMIATLAPCVSTGSWLKCVEFVPTATVVLSLLKIIVLHCRFSEIWAKIVLRACLALITCVCALQYSGRLLYIWPSCAQRLASVWNLLVANRLWTGMIFGSYAQDCWRLCLWLFSFKKYCTPSSLGNLNSKFYWQFLNTSNSWTCGHCWKPRLPATCIGSLSCRS